MKEDVIKVIGIAIILVSVVGVALFSFHYGIRKNDVATCIKLEKQSKEYELFFVTQLQKETCDYYGFTFAGSVDAPVHVDTLKEGQGLEFGVWYRNELGKFVANIKNHD